MYSYPNRIPLPHDEIQRIKLQMQSIEFDAILAVYDYQNIFIETKSILENSLAKYM
ncbi:MAG: hypothetical protein H7122_19620 [Chitinophagaceae bacterium]|nr:hypothetical protein [Chitinophagaceae bacterium]